MDSEKILNLLVLFLTSWQVRALIGLIVLDVLLGVAAALRRGIFDWNQLANFYRTMIVPYVLGYLALYLVVGFILPPDALGGDGMLNEVTITVAWGTLTATLLGSIMKNLSELYQKPNLPNGQ